MSPLVLTAIIALTAPQKGSAAPVPPFELVSKFEVPLYNDFSGSYQVYDKHFYVLSDAGCNAYDLKTFKLVWRTEYTKVAQAASFTLDASSVCLSLRVTDKATKKPENHIIVLDRRTGKQKWKHVIEGKNVPVHVMGRTLFFSRKPFTLSAMDAQTGKLNWTVPLSKPDEIARLKPRQYQDPKELEEVKWLDILGSTIFLNCGRKSFFIDPKTGKLLWSLANGLEARDDFVTTPRVILALQNDQAIARDVRTGRVLWKRSSPRYPRNWNTFGDNIITVSQGSVVALNPQNGLTRWSRKVLPKGGGLRVSKEHIYTFDSPGVILDTGGRVIWKGDRDLLPDYVVHANPDSLITYDRRGLGKLVRVPNFQVPKDSKSRVALARRWVRKIVDLESWQDNALEQLGDDAFEPALESFLIVKGDAEKAFPADTRQYDKLYDLLKKISSTKRTEALLTALKQIPVNTHALYLITSILSEKGEPELILPYYLELMSNESFRKHYDYRAEIAVRKGIAKSRDPRAVDFLIASLDEPKTRRDWALEAYRTMAMSGDPKAIAAVLSRRKKRELLAPLSTRVLEIFEPTNDPDRVPPPVIEKTDAQGRTWGILLHPALGRYDDMWLLVKLNNRWTNPVFLNLSSNTYIPWDESTQSYLKIAGFTGKEILKQDWIPLLVGNKALTLDTDQDGLTDVAESRLGTNPQIADTDGDGDSDEVDPWPTVARRALTDEEQAFEAAYESILHGWTWAPPGIVVTPQGMKPFEMVGYPGHAIWLPRESLKTHPLAKCFESGIYRMSLSILKWNESKTEVAISLVFQNRSGDGRFLGVTVRKFGDRWIVVKA